MVGEGEIAEQIKTMFRVFRKKYELEKELAPLDCSQFRRPEIEDGQLRLF